MTTPESGPGTDRDEMAVLLREAEEATHPLRAIRGWDSDAIDSLIRRLVRALLSRSRAVAPAEPRELMPVQYLAGLIEGAIWQERSGETSYCPRPELVEQWAAEIAPHIESYVRTALAGASARAALPSEPEAWPSDDVAQWERVYNRVLDALERGEINVGAIRRARIRKAFDVYDDFGRGARSVGESPWR